jgi:hypothetical protein
MLTLNLLDLLKKSVEGGRIIFNVTKMGKIFWDDMQMVEKWRFEDAIQQAMVAKRMFLTKLHNLNADINDSKLSFIGFQIHKTVWSNQLNIIPFFMKTMATLMKFFGAFISIEKCGEVMAPLFTENQRNSLKKSGKLISWKNKKFIDIKEDFAVLNKEEQDKLWKISLALCADAKTTEIAMRLHNALNENSTS